MSSPRSSTAFLLRAELSAGSRYVHADLAPDPAADVEEGSSSPFLHADFSPPFANVPYEEAASAPHHPAVVQAEEEKYSDQFTPEEQSQHYGHHEQLYDKGKVQASWSGWAWDGIERGASGSWKYFKNRAVFAKDWTKAHPIVAVSGVVFSLTNTANALVAIPGIATKNIFNSEAWKDVGGGKIFLSSLSGLSSMIVNSGLFYSFALSLKEKLRGLWDELLTRLDSRFTIPAAFVLAAGAAFSAAVIGIDAWMWAPSVFIAYAAGAGNALHTLLSRLFGILNLKNLIFNAVSDAVRFQKLFAEMLGLINPKYIDEVNEMIHHNVEKIVMEDLRKRNVERGSDEWYAEIKKPLNKEQYRKLYYLMEPYLREFYKLHPDLFIEKTLWHYIKKYAGIGADVIAAALMFASAYFPFSQRGYDGFRLVANLNVTSPAAEAGIGSVSGAASGLSYLESGWVIRNLFIQLSYSFYYKFQLGYILQTASLLFMIGLSGLGNATIARGIINNDENYLGLEPQTWLATIYTIAFIIAGVIANARLIPRLTAEPAPGDNDVNYLIYRNQVAPDDFKEKNDVEMQTRTATQPDDIENQVTAVKPDPDDAAFEEADQAVEKYEKEETERDALLDKMLGEDEAEPQVIINPMTHPGAAALEALRLQGMFPGKHTEVLNNDPSVQPNYIRVR